MIESLIALALDVFGAALYWSQAAACLALELWNMREETPSVVVVVLALVCAVFGALLSLAMRGNHSCGDPPAELRP